MNQIFSIPQRTRGYVYLFLGMLLVSCGSNNEETQQSGEQVLTAEVITLHPENATLEQTYPANLEGRINVEIRPQISGYIDKIHVDEGAFVKAGQPLFTINASVYREQKNTSLASLNVAKSQLASAKLELEKFEILTSNKVVSDFQYQKAKANYESAQAAVNQQQAQVASSDLNLGFTVVKAPVSGFIGRIMKRNGALVNPADAQALTTLSQVDEVYAYFSVSEKEVLRINETKTGATLLKKLKNFKNVALILADGKTYSHHGKVDMMDGQFDRSTGSVTLRASFPNPQYLLRSGNTGRIVLKTEETNVFKIPVLATHEMQDKLFVGMLNKASEMNRVELKDFLKSGDYYILKSGFKSGDKIVANELGSIPEKSVIVPKKL